MDDHSRVHHMPMGRTAIFLEADRGHGWLDIVTEGDTVKGQVMGNQRQVRAV